MAKRNLPNGAAIPMEPGERDRAVTIQQLAESTGSSGAPVETWTTLVTPVWMRRMQVRMTERFASHQLTTVPDTQWEMGYRADMDPSFVDVPKRRRLVELFDDEVDGNIGWIYEIVAADQIGRREGIELMTSGRKPVPA
jgi:hypothetical protein